MGNLEELAVQLYEAKQTEKAAHKTRVECEEAIAALVETGDNASKTVDVSDTLKVIVKRAMNIKPDVEAIRADESVPDEVKPLKMTDPTPASWAFDKKAYEQLREDHPDAFAKIAKHVLAVPAKVSVTLKLA